ncbi:MAG: sugar-binding protein [Victivallaceae bacterium]
MDNSIRLKIVADGFKIFFLYLTLICLLSSTSICYGLTRKYEPEKTDDERGYFIYAKPKFELISPSYFPCPQEIIKNKLSLCASLNEYAPATFHIYALKELKDAKISVTDLKSGEKIIPGSEIDLRIVKCWKQRDIIDAKKAVVIPELLVKDDRIELKGYLSSMPLTSYAVADIPVNTSKQIWITVKTSDSTLPGNYTGYIIIKPANGPETQLELSLEVMPIKLLPPNKSYAIYYTGSSFGLPWYVPKIYPDIKTWEEQCRKDLADIRAHGFQSVTTFAPISGSGKSGKLVLDLANLEKSLQFHKEAGLTGFTTYLQMYSMIDGKTLRYQDYCKTEEERKLFYYTMEKVVVETEALIKKRFDGVIRLFYYGIDEASRDPQKSPYKNLAPDYAVGVCKKIFEAIRRGGGLTTAAAYRSIAYGGFDVLGPLNDLPVYNYGSVYPGVSPEEIRKEAESKKGAYSYWQCWEENPRQNRLLSGFMLWKSGFTGIMPYCAWFASGSGNDPYDEFSGKLAEKNMYCVYPSLQGPIPTLQWEALREGINDVRYLTTLAELIKQEKNPQKAQKAQDVIDKILNRITLNISEALFDISENDLCVFRMQIAQAIMELSESKKKILEVRKIDRSLTLGSWIKEIEPQKLRLPLSETGKTLENKTAVYMFYDDVSLYLVFDCEDSEPDKLVSGAMKRRDGEWGDDGIEIFLDPGLTGKSYYHFLVNAKGLLSDNYYSSVQNRNTEWDSNAEVKSRVEKKGWITEVKIPWANIAADTVLPALWGVNLGRWEPKKNIVQTWASLSNRNFHQPEQFKKVQFKLDPAGYCCQIVNFSFGAMALGNNILTAGIKNNSSEKLDLIAEVIWAFNGLLKSENTHFSINPEETKNISLPYRIEHKGKNGKIIFNVINLKNNFLCLQKVKYFAVDDSIIKLKIDPVCYMSDNQLILGTMINLGDSDRNKATLTVKLLSPALDREIFKESIISPARITDIPLKIVELPPGLYLISAELFNEQKQLIESKTVEIKRINNPF